MGKLISLISVLLRIIGLGNYMFYFFKKTFICLSIMGMMFFSILYVDAAQISVVPGSDSIQTGIVPVQVMFDSENEVVNTIAGEIVFSGHSVQISEINFGDSLITFWMEKPTYSAEKNSISFSGIIPGGVVVQGKKLFSFVTSVETLGTVDIDVQNPIVLIHDGEGTRAKVQETGASIDFSIGNAGGVDTKKEKISPDKFLITRTKDVSIFNNDWFIVFSTQDKGSGVSHYQVCEIFVKKCTTAQSPHRLENQSKWYMTIVRAYDYDGNVQYTISVAPTITITLAVIFVSSILVVTYVFFFQKRNR